MPARLLTLRIENGCPHRQLAVLVRVTGYLDADGPAARLRPYRAIDLITGRHVTAPEELPSTATIEEAYLTYVNSGTYM